MPCGSAAGAGPLRDERGRIEGAPLTVPEKEAERSQSNTKINVDESSCW